MTYLLIVRIQELSLYFSEKGNLKLVQIFATLCVLKVPTITDCYLQASCRVFQLFDQIDFLDPIIV